MFAFTIPELAVPSKVVPIFTDFIMVPIASEIKVI